MKTALVGYTGFVGSNLLSAYEFTDLYHSKNYQRIHCSLFPAARKEKSRYWNRQI